MKALVSIFVASALAIGAQDLPPIKLGVELVQVYATVTDDMGRFVTDLKLANFQVSEDGKAQRIEAFSSDDSPLSIGILIDDSGPMGDNFALAKEAALAFLKSGNLRNEYFLLEFNNKPQITEDYTNDLGKLQKHAQTLRRSPYDGSIDAINLGLEKLREAANPRRVLLVFPSGGKLKNDHKARDVRSLARQLDVQIFGVTIVMPSVSIANADPGACASNIPGLCGVYVRGEGYDSALDIVTSVGGEGFGADSGPEFGIVCRRIAVALRNQYILGYQSTHSEHDGKYRRLQVKLAVRDVPDLSVHTRDGYYALEPDGGKQ